MSAAFGVVLLLLTLKFSLQNLVCCRPTEIAAIPREGFWMSSREFRLALQLRFGINNDSDDLVCACGKGSAQDHQHPSGIK